MEINEDQPDQKSKGYLFLAGYRNRFDHHHSYFCRTPKAERPMEKFLVKKKGMSTGVLMEAGGK